MPPFLPYHPMPTGPLDMTMGVLSLVVFLAIALVAMGVSIWYGRHHEDQPGAKHQH